MTDLEIEIYNFQNNKVRVSGTNNEPWFAVKDICNILELSNVTISLNSIPDKWRGVKKFLTITGEKEMLVINEAGLYKLIMRSNKPIAEKFQEWVCEDVLPSIRKKGDFILQEYKQQLEEKQKELTTKEQKISQLESENKEISRQILRKNKRKHKIGDCVYIVTNKNIPNQFKLGETDNINNRMMSFNNANPDEFVLHRNWYTRFHKKIEKLSHDTFQKFRISLSNEWFEISILDKVTEFITKQVEFLEQFDTRDKDTIEEKVDEKIDEKIDEKVDDEIIEEKPSETPIETPIEQPISTKKECTKCKLTLPFTRFYLRNENEKENQDKYRSQCKKCIHNHIKEIRQKVKHDANYNKKTCIDCNNALDIDLFYKKSDQTLFENCITCFKKKRELSENIKQCSECNEFKESMHFHNHSNGILRSQCKTCRNKSIVEERKKVPTKVIECEFCQSQIVETHIKVHQQTKKCLYKQGKINESESIRKAPVSYRSKRVLQLDKTTHEEIAQYPSVTEASKLTSIRYSNINSCCMEKCKTAGGFAWKYAT